MSSKVTDSVMNPSTTCPIRVPRTAGSVLILATLSVLGSTATLDAAPLALSECRLQSDNASGSISAKCATLEVPEDREKPSGKTIGLHVAVAPALNTRAQADPLFVLTGGPGQAASDFYLSMSPAFARIRRERDIVIVDQRGTGRSNRLDCPLPDDADLTEADPSAVQSHMRECLRSLAGDPSLYTTSIAVRDLEAVREALAYQRINLYGISYGTRVAQHYLRRYPHRVRSVVLDGVVPPTLSLGPYIVIDAQRALDAVLARCANSETCDDAFPNVREGFNTLRERLRQGALRISINDPVTAEPLEVRFGREELTAAVRMLSYSDETAAILPLLIHEAHANRPQAMAAQYEMIKRSMQSQLAYGMHFSVVCSEDAPRWDRENVSLEALQNTYLGADFMAVMRSACDVWPRGPVDEDFSNPLRSDAPVLILSGENDPVTPPSYGELILKTLPNAKHLVLAGQGHGQLAVGCMPRVVSQFIAGGSATELNDECLSSVTPTAFMITRSGPSP
jgi:pimeloyl-ACP methyl ester carboxylesterase